MKNFDLLFILGPTASGKTRTGVELARSLNGEIISADSRQVYRGMDIGTGKDLAEYGEIRYHLIDVADPGHEFSVFEFQRLFAEAFRDIRARGKVPVVVGGTGLYLDAILRDYRLPEVPRDEALRRELASFSTEDLSARLKGSSIRLHNTTDLLERDRLIRAIEIAEFKEIRTESPVPLVKAAVFGIKWPREILRRRITGRLKARMDHGLVEEVRNLLDSGVSFQTLDFYGLEYRYVARYLQGEFNRNDLFQKLSSAIHQFAKRQETWFRRMERQGIKIRWVDGEKDPAGAILDILEREE